MKKNLAALLATFVLGGAVFAENYTKGIDLHLGIPIAKTNMSKDFYGFEYEKDILEVGGQIKLATYDCFLLNDMLGIYASLGVNMGLFSPSSSIAIGELGNAEWTDDIAFDVSCEFMVGPAFGVNLGGVRFQTGLAFHAVFAWGIRGLDGGSDEDSTLRNYTHYNSFGFALTPQFRFGASKRCSFILGCDLTFDFPDKLTYRMDGEKFDVEFDDGFRFGATPYIGLGINF